MDPTGLHSIIYLSIRESVSVMPNRLVVKMNKMVKESGVQIMKLWFFHDNLYVPTNGETIKVEKHNYLQVVHYKSINSQ